MEKIIESVVSFDLDLISVIPVHYFYANMSLTSFSMVKYVIQNNNLRMNR